MKYRIVLKRGKHEFECILKATDKKDAEDKSFKNLKENKINEKYEIKLIEKLKDKSTI